MDEDENTTAPEDFDGLDDAYLAWLPDNDTRDYMFGE